MPRDLTVRVFTSQGTEMNVQSQMIPNDMQAMVRLLLLAFFGFDYMTCMPSMYVYLFFAAYAYAYVRM